MPNLTKHQDTITVSTPTPLITPPPPTEQPSACQTLSDTGEQRPSQEDDLTLIVADVTDSPARVLNDDSSTDAQPSASVGVRGIASGSPGSSPPGGRREPS
jgi:hypothetical protein